MFIQDLSRRETEQLDHGTRSRGPEMPEPGWNPSWFVPNSEPNPHSEESL
jgi:hypothetical protein